MEVRHKYLSAHKRTHVQYWMEIVYLFVTLVDCLTLRCICVHFQDNTIQSTVITRLMSSELGDTDLALSRHLVSNCCLCLDDQMSTEVYQDTRSVDNWWIMRMQSQQPGRIWWSRQNRWSMISSVKVCSIKPRKSVTSKHMCNNVIHICKMQSTLCSLHRRQDKYLCCF